jgi:hypothetical protein
MDRLFEYCGGAICRQTIMGYCHEIVSLKRTLAFKTAEVEALKEKVRVMRGIAMDLHQAFNCVVTIGVPVRKGRIYDSTWQEYGKALSTGAGEEGA